MLRRDERLKGAIAHVAGNTGSVIGEDDLAAPVGRGGQADTDPALPVHRLRGVQQHILKDMLQLPWIGVGNGVVAVHLDLDGRQLRIADEQVGRLADEALERHGRRLRGRGRENSSRSWTISFSESRRAMMSPKIA